MNLTNYLEQHEGIKQELETVKNLEKKHRLEETAAELALHVNHLAGKMKIHLVSEDKYLYPGLIETGKADIKKAAKEYQEEMGDLFTVFTEFKNKYNTRSKILEGGMLFQKELLDIIAAIERRIQKEEEGLYQLLY